MMKLMTMPIDDSDAPANPAPPPNPGADSAAFSILAREHHRGLLVYARALSRDEATAADLVQDAFLTAWQGLGRFDITRDFGAWMRGIVRNKWREYCRKHQREVDVDDDTLALWEDRLAAQEQSRMDGRGPVFDLLDDCLTRLPAAMSDVVQRFYYRREDGETTATALGIDPAALRKRLQRAREMLRQCLDRKLQPAG
jgi:RNA polymerase sigma factor CnrH